MLGFIYSEKNDCSAHIDKKEKEITGMMANLSLTVNSDGMGKMFLQTMIVIYTKCMLPKLLYGMAAMNVS